MSPTVAETYVSPSHARWLASAPQTRWRTEEATLVFADVSGFTALTERLGRRGKIGAEETTVAVQQLFLGLLKSTRDAAGEILKFGGDAVLAYFAGEAHQIRGAAAALAMQDAVRHLRRLRTAAGTVSVRVSAGVASGTAHLFLAGEAPCELLVAGPLASEVVALEAAASAGEVIAGPGTLAALPARCIGAELGPGRVLRAAPLVPMVDIPTRPPGFDPRPALPAHLHEHEPGDGEHRVASVGFLQAKGIAALLDAEGPAAAAAALDAFVGAATRACAAHGVTFVATDVDRDAAKIMVAAGAPAASPDDDDRLLHALCDVVCGDQPLAVRAGANRGRVFMTDIGSEDGRAWTVMGDAVNVAARVMAHAEPRQVLAATTVLERVRDDFARTPVPPFAVKGKTAPLRAEIVGPARGERRRVAPVADAPLVGRDVELMVIGAAFDSARQGRHVLVEVVGEPGIGKSRLVQSALERAGGLTLVTVAGGPYSASSPYRAVRAPLRRLLGAEPGDDDDAVEVLLRRRVAEVAPNLEQWLPLVAIPFGLSLAPNEQTAALSPEFARARLHMSTGLLIERVLPHAPVLLLIEDAHWLDEASSGFLAYLARQRRTPGGCLLVTRRDVPGGLSLAGEHGAARLDLRPLEREAAVALAASAAEDDEAALPPRVTDLLVERAGGNPLLLRELMAAVRGGAPPEALPASVEALAAARIDTLPERDRQILRQAAVIGARMTTDLLGAVLELKPPVVAAALDRLADFLVPDAGSRTVRFRHALLRDAAYEALPFRRRRELHGRIADFLVARAGDGGRADPELLTIHVHAAHRWPETWEHAARAAEHALERAAPIEAAGYFERALEAGRAMRVEPAALARLAERLGEAYRLGGRFEDAGRAFERARRHARGDAVLNARLCLLVGRLRERSTHQSEALRWFTRGLTALDGETGRDAEVVRADLWLSRAVVRLRQGHMLQGVRAAERAGELAALAGDRLLVARAAMILHWAHTEMGTPERERYREAALPIFVELGDLEYQGKTLNNLGIDAYWSGRWDEAVALYERGRDALERIGDLIEAAVLRNNIAEIRSDQGRLDEAEAEFREVLATLRAAEFWQGVGLVYSNLGRVAVRRGDTEEAARLFDRSRETLSRVGADTKVLELETREAERLVAAGRPREALALAAELRETIERRREQPAHLALTERLAALALLQLGDVAGARQRLAESIAVARAVGAAYEEALSLDALSRCGGPGAAEAAARAAELLAGLGVVAVSLPASPVAA